MWSYLYMSDLSVSKLSAREMKTNTHTHTHTKELGCYLPWNNRLSCMHFKQWLFIINYEDSIIESQFWNMWNVPHKPVQLLHLSLLHRDDTGFHECFLWIEIWVPPRWRCRGSVPVLWSCSCSGCAPSPAAARPAGPAEPARRWIETVQPAGGRTRQDSWHWNKRCCKTPDLLLGAADVLHLCDQGRLALVQRSLQLLERPGDLGHRLRLPLTELPGDFRH